MSGVFFTDKNIGRLMKRVAVKGIIPDWTMYFFRDDEMDYEEVAMHGDKLSDRDTIQRLVNCEDAVMALYRN
jgi:hypothetical protein